MTATSPLPPGTIPQVIEYYLEDVLVLRKEGGIPTYSYPSPTRADSCNADIYWDSEPVLQIRNGQCTLNRLRAIANCRQSFAK